MPLFADNTTSRKEASLCFCTTKTTPVNRGKLAFAPGGRQRFFGVPPATSEQWARFDCRTIVHLAKRQKRFFSAWPQDPIVAQLYILLIMQSHNFKPEKANVFGLDVSVGSGVGLCGLHPARKRSKGVWGLWKIAPN
jgi:hypothetical protein